MRLTGIRVGAQPFPWARSRLIPSGGTSPGILLVTERLQSSGIAQVVATKATWLARRGHRVQVLSWTIATHLSGHPNPLLEALAGGGVPVSDLLALRGRGRLLRRALRLREIALRENFPVVVGHGLMGSLLAVLAKLFSGGRLRAVLELHSDPASYAREFNPTVCRLSRLLVRRADAILAVSAGVRRDSARYFGLEPERVETVHNPISIDRVRRLAAEDAPSLGTLGSFILGMGRLQDSKRFPDLIRAFALVRARLPLKLVILGDGPSHESLLRCAREAGVGADVLLPGFVPNPFPYLARAGAFALASEVEGFSLVLMEALACGTPVISSRCHWGPEEVLMDGKCGLLHEVGDVEGLAAGLLRILSEPGETAQRVDAGLRRIEDFSEEAIMERVERLYLGPYRNAGTPAGA